MSEAVLLINATATWFMTGVIWFVQVVHYPLFAGVGGDSYVSYQDRHMRQTTWVVFPAMSIELVTAAGLVLAPPARAPGWMPWLGAALVAAIWASTVLVQVPLHRRLTSGFEAGVHRRLVVGNWGRTVMWTTRSVLVAAMLRM